LSLEQAPSAAVSTNDRIARVEILMDLLVIAFFPWLFTREHILTSQSIRIRVVNDDPATVDETTKVM
jgi:hypothetical protein